LEKAQLDDLDSVRNLNSLLRLKHIEDFYWDGAIYVKSAILEKRCYVIRDSGAVKGAMIIENRKPCSDYPADSLAIGTIAVHPGARKKGFGIKLVEFAKDLAFTLGKRLFVESFFEYRKLNFYTRLGFAKGLFKKYNGRPYHVFFLDPNTIPAFPTMKRVSLAHRHEYSSYLAQMPVVPSDVTFENLFLYNSRSRQIHLSLLNKNVIVLSKNKYGQSLYPVVGNSDLDGTYAKLLDWLPRKTKEDLFRCVPCSTVNRLTLQTTAGCKIVKDRNNFDYLHEPAALSAFDDPALRTQNQNLIRFMAEKPEFRRMTLQRTRSFETFQKGWMEDYRIRQEKKNKALPKRILAEDRALRKALAYSLSLGLSITGVFLKDILEGFSIHSIFGKTMYVHFEKATRKKGAYQSLVQKTAKIALNCKADFINREQDLGIPGLRAGKKRYLPIGFLEKCNIGKIE
ncbi:MAG: GNAT family N-acetyltransferase, partial [Deltaproteobacteria bacterium]|nr:GNAT family N-acetyltransferase [Deltaproteobacteria bacterium]